MSVPIITLTTDFGLKDPYVAEMKATILSINSVVTIIDITHQTEKFDVKMGAYLLASAQPFFPKGTIHVAVIDPGVGTRRRPIIIHTTNGYFIGPDNGVLALAAKNAGKIAHIHTITNRELMLTTVSNTFHGRDIFAPAAAYLAGGTPLAEFGPEIRKIMTPEFARTIRKDGVLIGKVVHIDGFGNIITNFSEEELKSIDTSGSVNVKLRESVLRLKICKSYSEVRRKDPLVLIGSHNFLEIAINQGDAADILKAKRGDKVELACLSC